VQKIAYNLQDLNAERMEHDFCGSEFLEGDEVDENFQASQETRRTKRKSNNDDDATTKFLKFRGIIECTYVLSLLFTFRESVESAKNKNIDRSTESAEDWV
jgi:hypothetical protein